MSKTTLRKGKQDDKFSLAIREIQASNPDNKKCFDCEQRGPTYINTTIGSFICTKCSGMLRGINPPHRIKSISMSSFSADEVEMMRSRGNTYCRAVWLGLYDAGPIDYKDEEKIKEFIIAKYEKKRHYVEPSQADMTRVASVSPAPESSTISSTERPRPGLQSSSLIGSTLKARMDPVNISVSRPGQGGSLPRPQDPPRPQSNGAPARPPPPQQVVQAPAPSPPRAAPPATTSPPKVLPTQQQPDFGNFADFDSAAFDSLPADALPGPPPPLPTPSQPAGGRPQAREDSQPCVQDKYSALAELDDLFKSTAIQPVESVFPEPTLFPDPAPAAPPPADLFQSLLETSPAAPSMFGGERPSVQGAASSPMGWGGRGASPSRRSGGWGEGGGALVPGAGASHSTNPFGTSPSNPPGSGPYFTPDNNNDLFAAAPKPFFADKPAVAETNPWSGVAAFTADMKPAHNPNNPFL